MLVMGTAFSFATFGEPHEKKSGELPAGWCEVAGAGDAVSVGQPQFQGMLNILTDLLLLGRSCGMVQDHLPCSNSVGTLDGVVGPDEIQIHGIDLMKFD